MPKRIIVCCDGTWYSADKGDDNLPSNVARLSRMIARQGKDERGQGIEQIVYYQTGVGTGALTVMDSIKQGATGAGLEENVVTAYHFIATNYAKGDEIFLFGFSRGAYTARALAGCLTNMGLLKPVDLEFFRELYQHYKAHGGAETFGNEDEHYEVHGGSKEKVHHHHDANDKSGLKRCNTPGAAVGNGSGGGNTKPKPEPVEVKVVGVWDTVGSLGLPESMFTKMTGWNKSFEFHNTALNPLIKNAFQALALDEHRGAFTPTLWYLDDKPIGKSSDGSGGISKLGSNLVQCWFPGYHADIGGGSTSAASKDVTAIDEMALAWMCDRVDGLLTFDEEAATRVLKPVESSAKWTAGATQDPLGLAYRLNIAGGDILRTPGAYHKELDPEALRPKDNESNDDVEKRHDYPTKEFMHPSIQLRIASDKNYEPMALSTHTGWKYVVTPKWEFDDRNAGAKGSFWIRPEMEKRKGWFSHYPIQREIRIKEHTITDRVPGKNNFEARLLPSHAREILSKRGSFKVSS